MKKTKRWLGLLTFCMMGLLGQMSFAQEVIIGTGTSTQHFPLNYYWGYGRSAAIYTAAEMGTTTQGGEIESISYYTNSAPTNGNTKIYLREVGTITTQTAETWATKVGSLVASYDATPALTSGGWTTFVLDTPFVLTAGENLEILVETTYGGTGNGSSTAWVRYSTQTNSHQYWQADNNPPTANGTVNGQRPNVKMYFYEDCPTPTELTVNDITANSATLGWTSTGTSFDIKWGAPGFNVETEGTLVPATDITGTSHTITGLTAETQHQFYVRQDCSVAGDGYSTWAGPYTFFTGYCVPTTTGTYFFTSITTTGGDSDISLSKTAKDAGGYGNYSATQMVSGFEGQQIGFNMVMNTSTHYFYIWIDFNNDLDFTDAGETVVATTTYLGTFSGTLTIPALPLGDYRIRVGSSWSGAIGPCGSANGEYQDFTLTVIAPPPCLAPTALTAFDITYNSAVLGWTSDGILFDVEIVEEGGTQTETPTYTGVANNFETTIPLTPSTSYEFYVRQDCGVNGESTWVGPFSFKTECLPPSLTGTTPGSACGQGEVELSATADAGASIGWYATQTGGPKLAEGDTFTTPLITETTSFWAAAFTGTNGNGARLAPNYTSGAYAAAANYGLVFTATDSFVLNTVDVYLLGTAGNLIVNLTTTTGTILQTQTIALPALGTLTTPVQYTITLDFDIAPGDYRLIAQSSPNMVREASLGGFPYAVGDVASVTGGYISGASTTYYYFYNWAYTAGCFSDRTEVVATVTTAPDFVLSGTADTICEGETSDTVTITTGTADYDTYVWNPATGVTGNATTGWAFNPTATTTYTLTASQSAGTCAASVDFVVTVNDAPVITATASVMEICDGESVDLGVSGGSTLTYCNSAFTQTTFYEWITNVNFAGINNTSGSTAGGYTDYTSQVANVTVGTASTLSVTINADEADYIYVWIDWNQDGVLNGTGETYTVVSNTASNGPHTLSITPPATALNGNTRMRVMVDWNNSTPNPCRSATYGETEDYTVNVTGGVDLYDYSWSDGTSVVGTTGNLTVTPTATTTYTVTATGTNGCTATESVMITVNSVPVINSITASATEICEGASVDLGVSGGSTLTYCNSAFTQTTFYEWITNVNFAGINNTSGSTAGGYTNYTSQVANVTVGTASTLSVTINADEADYIYVWIDWNQDGVLNGTGETYTVVSNTASNGPHTLSITPPATALNGNTRMRVMVDWNNSTPNPCRSATYGETEDYTVNVTGGVDLYDYSWSDGTSVVGTTGNLTVTPTATTTYTVTATGANGCTATESVMITVTPAPEQPVIACYETATFNTATCQWEVTGIQPEQPVIACYETATFNTATCQWEVTGIQPEQPVIACYETATFNNVTCQWNVTGTQPEQPVIACYETAAFNAVTCQWEVTGTQPEQPVIACYETAAFNNVTCQWDVTGAQPEQPVLACYETTIFNSATCQWDVTGEQPEQPILACYETATFNDTSCQWDVTGTAPAAPTADSPQTLADGQTVANIVVTATGTLTWYADEDLTDEVSESMVFTEGSYTFWVTQTIDGCESDAIAIEVEVTLSTNEFDLASFRTYPNPVKDFFNVSYSKDIKNVIVVNMLGQTVIENAVNATATQIDMTGLPTGSYFVRVTVEGAVKTVKVIKQ